MKREEDLQSKKKPLFLIILRIRLNVPYAEQNLNGKKCIQAAAALLRAI